MGTGPSGSQGLSILDLSDKKKPRQVGLYRSMGQAYATALHPTEKLAYLADGTGGLHVVDIADPGRPREILRLPDFAPHPLDPEVRFSGNPGWADAITVIPWRQYATYGDRRILEECYDSARRWVDWSERNNPDLLWRSSKPLTPAYYGDWLNADTFQDIPGLPRSGGAVPGEIYATAWFAHSAAAVARMARVLGRAEDERRYADLARRVTAIHIPRNGLYELIDRRLPIFCMWSEPPAATPPAA